MPKRTPEADKQTAFDLKAAREARSMTQHDVAALLHTNQSSISRWEVDGNMPPIHRMAWDLHWRVQALTAAKKGKHVR